MSLVYLAHALGRDPILRPRNIERVQRWFRFLIDYGPESWAIQIPWLPYALNLDEDTYRMRGIRDGQAMIKVLDIICLVGGEDTRNSAGAIAERDMFKADRKGVCDLTFLGAEPPEGEMVTQEGLFLSLDHREAWARANDTAIVPTGAIFPLRRENVAPLILKHLVR